MADAGLAHDAQAPDPQAADEDEARTESEGLDDVGRTADARVVADVGLGPDGSSDGVEGVEAGDGSVDLPAGVVADDQAITAGGYGAARVGYRLDPLQEERAAVADLLPGADQPGEFVPGPGAAVPDGVDPGGAGALRLPRRVDAHFFEALLEDMVGEPEVGADAAVESVVASSDVVVSPAELPRIGGEHADVEAAFEGSREQGNGKLVVMRHVELEEAGALAVGLCDFFNRRAAGCAETVW